MSLAIRRGRIGIALAAAGATALPFAEGVLKNGWIEVAFLVPVALFLAMSEPPVWCQNLLLTLVTLCLTISGVDLLLRPAIGLHLHYTPTNIYPRKLPQLPIVGRWDPSVAFAGEAYGDLAAVAGDPALREPRRIEFRTDEAGFRNEPRQRPIDLLVLGDSFAAGAGTSQDHVFVRVLETRYGRSVYNLSYPGGPYDEFVNFAIESPRLTVAPRAVVLWTLYAGNDLDDAGGETWDLKALPWRNGFRAWLVEYRTFRNRSPLNQIMQGFMARVRRDASDVVVRSLPDGRPVLFYNKHEAWSARPRADIERHPNFANLERTMAVMRTLAGERGVELVVLIFPTKGDVYRWLYEQRLPRASDVQSSGFAQAVLATCERMRLKCLDAKPSLVTEARRLFDATGELLWWRDDTHPNGRGHQAIADLVARDVLGLARQP